MTTFTSNRVDLDGDQWLSSTKGNTSNEVESGSQPADVAEIQATLSDDDLNQQVLLDKNQMKLLDASAQICYSSSKTEPAADVKFKKEISWDNIRSLVKPSVKVNMPEIKVQKPLDFVNLSRSELVSYLAVGCQLLLEKLDEIRLDYSGQSVYTNYQIELRRTKENASFYELHLRVNPLEWYALEKHNDKDIKLKGNDYVNRVENECDKCGDSYSESSKRCNDKCRDKKENRCTEPIIYDGGNQCGFFVCSKHQIYTERGVWYAAARCNKVPVITMHPKKHYSNKQWIVTTGAWEIFCQIVYKLQDDLQLKALPFERAYINFAYWQSQASRNEQPRNNGFKPDDCHGHINMVLTAQTIVSCKNAPEHLRILQYSTKYPPNHRLDDAKKLKKKIFKSQFNEEPCIPDVDEEPCIFDVYEEPCTPDVDEHRITLEIYAKSTIISHLLNKYGGKTNRINYDVYI